MIKVARDMKNIIGIDIESMHTLSDMAYRYRKELLELSAKYEAITMLKRAISNAEKHANHEFKEKQRQSETERGL